MLGSVTKWHSAFLALLIVSRVATAIVSSERRAEELTAWERRYETLVNTMGSLVYEWAPQTMSMCSTRAAAQARILQRCYVASMQL